MSINGQSKSKIAISLATLESELHEVNSIKSGIKLHNAKHVEYERQEDGSYWARVDDRGSVRTVILNFTRDGSYFKSHFCTCGIGGDGKCLCKHIVATVLTIQGGVIESGIKLGDTASVTEIVNESNTAKAAGSGSLDVYATPMMIALMERAACECINASLPAGQASVGIKIEVEHNAASLIGTEITASAAIDYVFGQRIEFSVTANDGSKEIGKGRHVRVIVDSEQFMSKAKKKK